MADEKRVAAIDADFFGKLTEKDKDGILFLKIMDELGVTPVMHQYVYEYELAYNSTAKKLKETGRIQIYDYTRFITPQNNENYIQNFKRAFLEFNYMGYDTRWDVFSYHHEKQNLGEIRTALMAFYMGIDLFMSDDGQAKEFTMNKLSSRKHRIVVYNLFDTLVEVHKLDNSNVKWMEIKGMAKNVLSVNKYNRLNEIWHN